MAQSASSDTRNKARMGRFRRNYLMSQVYIFYDQAGTIPGVPGMFSHCQAEVDEDGSVNVNQLSRGQETVVLESTIEPVAEEAPAQEPIEQPIEQEQQTDGTEN